MYHHPVAVNMLTIAPPCSSLTCRHIAPLCSSLTCRIAPSCSSLTCPHIAPPCSSFRHWTADLVSRLLPFLGLQVKVTYFPFRVGYTNFLYDVITKCTILRNCAEGFACFKDWHRSPVTTSGNLSPWEPWRHYSSFRTSLLVIRSRFLCKSPSCGCETWGKRISECNLTWGFLKWILWRERDRIAGGWTNRL
jgi:hypothetical protein